MTDPSPMDPQRPDEVSPPQPSAGSEPPAPPPPPQYPPVSPQYPPAPPEYPPAPSPYQPAPYPPTAQSPGGTGEQPKVIGILALVFGAAALLFGLIPLVGIFIGGLFGTAAIVLGIIGIIKSHRIMSIIGIALSLVGAILSFAITNSVADDVADDIADGIESGATGAPAEEGTEAEEAAEPEPEIAVAGDTVTDGDFEFIVGGVEQGVAEVGGEFLSEEAQGEFVIIDLTVKNIGDEASYFSDSDQILFDTAGNEYSTNTSAGIYLEDNDIWLAEINPGNQVEGKIVFDVPVGTALAKLELHDSFLSGGAEVSLQ